MWTKNLFYPDESFRANVLPSILSDPECSADTALEVALLTLQQRLGQQFVVRKSDTKKFASYGPQYAYNAYPWPCRVFELYSEHPEIPTVLAAKLNAGDMTQMGFKTVDIGGLKPDEYTTHILLQERDGEGFTLQCMYTDEEMDTIRGLARDPDQYIAFHDSRGEFDDDDARILGLMANFVYKAVGLCVEGKVVAIDSDSLRHGGRPGVRNRPVRPVAILRPPEKYEHKPENA